MKYFIPKQPMNKNYLLLFIIILHFTNYTIAQEKNAPKISKFSIGINAGPNYNSLRGDSFADKYKSNFNYFLGLSLQYKINKHFSVVTNLNYEQSPFKSEYRSGPKNWADTYMIKDKTTFTHLNIPVLLQYNLGVYNEFFINGGIFYNPIIKVSNEMINTDTGDNISDLDFNELFKKKNYGLSLGIGMNFKFDKRDNVSVEIRDDFGLNDIGATKLGNISTTKTNSIKLVFNWSLNL
ncbi:porin family protein [Flavobacterium flavipallidum]|uniref:Porin family protein n=1 Tax=Flavobacterium flavipallidum TaxID=3139140 RepID=A0ABU9HLW2_9FLAO